MEVWEPYTQSTLAHLDNAKAKIVFDKLYVGKHVHDVVNKVRKAEHRAVTQAGDPRLTGTKCL